MLVLGATGFVGGAIARDLVARGHRVTGLARTDVAAEQLRRDAVEPVRGDLADDLAPVSDAAIDADVLVIAAQLDPQVELRLVTEMLDRLAGRGPTVVFISGSGVMMQRTDGAWSPDSYAEADPFVAEPLAETRVRVEQLVIASAHRGIRSLVVRPGMIWGPGDHGHVPMTYASVAATGAASYVGAGLNTYSHVHMDDVARLVALAIDEGTAGGLYHAVAGEIPTRWIAESVATDLGVPSRSVTPGEAVDIWGEFGALVLGSSSRIRAPRSTQELGWTPRHTDLLTTVGDPRHRALAGR